MSSQELKFITSTRAMRVYKKKMRDFTKDPKEKIWGKSKFLGLGGVLETSYHSTTLQEVDILSTLVYFHHKGCLALFSMGLFG